MQRFFVTPDQVGEDKIRIQGSDVNHMKNVLRMRPGEEVMVSDGNNRQYRSAEKSQQKSQRYALKGKPYNSPKSGFLPDADQSYRHV